MNALTLYRPWPWSMLHAPPEVRKGIENRTWPLPPKRIGERIVLHAGKHYDNEGEAFILQTLGLSILPFNARDEGLIGSVVFTHCLSKENPLDGLRADAIGQARWFFGPFGFIAADVIAFEKPIPCKGAMGFWKLPPELETAVRVAEALARSKPLVSEALKLGRSIAGVAPGDEGLVLR